MDMMVVDIALNFSGLFGERLEIRFHQPDMDGVAILPSDREQMCIRDRDTGLPLQGGK